MKKLLLIFLFIPMAFAGDEAGNGGDAVVCRDRQGEITKVELLDLYEGRVMRGMKYKFSSSSNLDLKFKYLLKRVKERAPEMAENLAKGYKTFFANARLIPDIVLNDVPDSGHVFVPRNCLIEQIAVQKDPNFFNDKRYIISKDLWDHMDNNNKLALITHELLYKKALERSEPHKNSIKVRFLNAFIFSKGYLEQDDRTLVLAIKDSNIFDYAKFQGYEVLVEHIDKEDSRPWYYDKMIFRRTENVQIGVNTFPLRQLHKRGNDYLSMVMKPSEYLNVSILGKVESFYLHNYEVSLWPNGNVKLIRDIFFIESEFEIENVDLYGIGFIELNEETRPIKIISKKSEKGAMVVQDKKVKISSPSYKGLKIEMWEDGTIKRYNGLIKETVVLKGSDGKDYEILGSNEEVTLLFNENGLLQKY